MTSKDHWIQHKTWERLKNISAEIYRIYAILSFKIMFIINKNWGILANREKTAYIKRNLPCSIDITTL